MHVKMSDMPTHGHTASHSPRSGARGTTVSSGCSSTKNEGSIDSSSCRLETACGTGVMVLTSWLGRGISTYMGEV